MCSAPGGCHAGDAQEGVREEAGVAVEVHFHVLVPDFLGWDVYVQLR